MIRQIQDEILSLKEKNDFCILAHSYQSPDICEIADFVGDSYALSVKAQKAHNKNILMCGVRFMAESAKILSPGKNVYLANPLAGCPMAEQMSKSYIEEIKKLHPDYAVVAYINTTAELKTLCDVCVTSSSAVKIVKRLENNKIIFIPDCNLGSYVAKQVPEKEIKLLAGGCPIHSAITPPDVEEAKKLYPDALLLVHPECVPEVVEKADFVGSTAEIMDFAEKSLSKEFIIGTENSIAQHLQIKCPDKKFYLLSKKLVCFDMKATTLSDVRSALKFEGGEEIVLPEETIQKALFSINEMIRLGS